MVVKVYISGISGNKEVKKRQQRVLMILDSKNIKYDLIDITEPGRESDKDFMQNKSTSNGGTVSDPNPRSPLPPQVFNDEEYCGDYDQFDLANEMDTLEVFLKLEAPTEELQDNEKENIVNGNADGEKTEEENKGSKENSQEQEAIDEGKKEGTPAKESTPGEEIPAKEDTPAKEGTPTKDDNPAKEDSAEGTSVKEGTPAKEGTPVKEEVITEDDLAKETPQAKESSPERKSIEKEENKTGSPKASKENTPEKDGSVNENGTVSSREQSQEKSAGEEEHVDVAEKKKENPSEALIQSEQAAANE